MSGQQGYPVVAKWLNVCADNKGVKLIKIFASAFALPNSASKTGRGGTH